LISFPSRSNTGGVLELFNSKVTPNSLMVSKSVILRPNYTKKILKIEVTSNS
jgi:hypothetical protein